MNANEATIINFTDEHDFSEIGLLAFDSGKMTMQEYKQRYFYIFKMTDNHVFNGHQL